MPNAGVESMHAAPKVPAEVLPLDLAHLRRFTMGDEQLELEILGLFAHQLPITIADLNNARTEKEWGMAAHTLKGSARAVGAWSLATAAENAESLASLEDAAERSHMVRRIEEAANAASSYISTLSRQS
jgi:HPt (histidine-containing phosphotransfer) domain-containing protein